MKTLRLLLTRLALGPDTGLALPVEVVSPKEKTGHP
jgi:hypothetical protein